MYVSRSLISRWRMLTLKTDLDRSNLGNARLQGLPEDILNGDPTGSYFDWVNSSFFFSYVRTCRTYSGYSKRTHMSFAIDHLPNPRHDCFETVSTTEMVVCRCCGMGTGVDVDGKVKVHFEFVKRLTLLFRLRQKTSEVWSLREYFWDCLRHVSDRGFHCTIVCTRNTFRYDTHLVM